MASTSQKTSRKENWCEGEKEALRQGYFDYSAIIDGKLSPCITSSMKEQTWNSIQERVNSQGNGSWIRSLGECKKKKLSDTKTGEEEREEEERRSSQDWWGTGTPVRRMGGEDGQLDWRDGHIWLSRSGHIQTRNWRTTPIDISQSSDASDVERLLIRQNELLE